MINAFDDLKKQMRNCQEELTRVSRYFLRRANVHSKAIC